MNRLTEYFGFSEDAGLRPVDRREAAILDGVGVRRWPHTKPATPEMVDATARRIDAELCANALRRPPRGTTARPVVVPDRGVAYPSIVAAVHALWNTERRRVSRQGIGQAIAAGTKYAGRYWDWRYPAGWNEEAMWDRLVAAGLVDAGLAGPAGGSKDVDESTGS